MDAAAQRRARRGGLTVVRVLVACVGVRSHWLAMAPLVIALRRQGHLVAVTCATALVGEVERVGAAVFERSPTSPPVPVDRPSAETTGRGWGHDASESLHDVEAAARRWRAEVIVADWVDFAASRVAASSGIPYVEFGWGAQLVAAFRVGAQSVLGPDPAGWSPLLSLDQWPRSLSQRTEQNRVDLRYHPYGGAGVTPPRSVLGRPRVCITMGTVLTAEDSMEDSRFLLERLVESILGALDVDVVLGVPADLADAWRLRHDRLAGVGWLGLGDAVRASDVVVHHGGHATTLTCLLEGRPQLVLPRFGDQFVNAKAVADGGSAMALDLARALPGHIAKAVRELLCESAFMRAAERVSMEMRRAPDADRVVQVIESAVFGS